MDVRDEVEKFEEALIDWDEEVLATWPDSPLKLKDRGALDWSSRDSSVRESLFNQLTREKIYKLFGWQLLSPTYGVGVLADLFNESWRRRDPYRESCVHVNEFYYLVSRYDKEALASWRDEMSGATIAHYVYYGFSHCAMHVSALLRYLVDECGLDPKAEVQEIDIGGFKPLPEGEHGQTLLELAIGNKDMPSVYFLLERGCDPNVYKTEGLDTEEGRDPLMREVHLFSRSLDAEIREEHRAESRDEDVTECTDCRHFLPPKADDSIRDLFTIIKECIRHGYDTSYEAFYGLRLEDFIGDMITRDRRGERMIEWYRHFIEDPREEEFFTGE